MRFFQRNTRPCGKTKLTSDEIPSIRARRLHPERSNDDKPFRNADASGLDISGFSWDGEDFTGCDLRGANLSGCTFNESDFRHADLWNADLRDSDLTDAKNLLPAQLAATDLSRAKLPPDISSFQALDAVKDLTDNSSKVFLIILGAVLYTFLTIATTKDAQLIVDTNLTKLPVIGTDVPIISFYIVTPLVLLGVFIYFHIYLQRLWESISQLPAVFLDGRRLDEKTPAWLVTDLARKHFPRLLVVPLALSRLQSILSMVLAYWLVPISLSVIWLRLLFLRDWWINGFHILMLAIAFGFAAQAVQSLSKTLEGRAPRISRVSRVSRLIGVWEGLPAGLITLLLAFTCSFVLLEWDRYLRYDVNVLGRVSLADGSHLSPWKILGEQLEEALDRIHIRTWVSIDQEDISIKPTTWTGLAQNSETELALAKGARLTDKSFRRIHAEGTFFGKSVMERVDLDAGYLALADFRGAGLVDCSARSTSFIYCQFSDPLPSTKEVAVVSDEIRDKFHGAKFVGCHFEDAVFENATLSLVTGIKTEFKGCSFDRATCVGIKFIYCFLYNDHFESADCRKADFESCVFDRASFRDADCAEAVFEAGSSAHYLAGCSFYNAILDRAKFRCKLVGVDFTNASLVETDFSKATGLTEEQLRKAKTLYHAKLPEPLDKQLADEINRPSPAEPLPAVGQ